MTGGRPRPKAARARVTVGYEDKSLDDDDAPGSCRDSEPGRVELLAEDSKLVPLLT